METTTTSNKIKTPLSPDGYVLGQSTSDLVGFYGLTTPIAQRGVAAQSAVITTAATSSAPFGFATAAQADAVVTLVNELRAALVALNLIKGSA